MAAAKIQQPAPLPPRLRGSAAKHCASLASGLMAALLCGAAHAQPDLQLYGLLDVNLRYDRAGNASIASLGSGLSRGSRLGWRSQEALGLGWKVSSMGEMGLNVDDGHILATGASAPGFGRQLWIGLDHADLGSFAVGRQYTPLFAMAAGALDPLGANYLGAIPTTLALQGGMTARVSNALTYSWGYGNAMDSPAPRGRFSLSAMYAPGEAQSGHHAGFALGYGQDPWFLGYALHRSDAATASQPLDRHPQMAQVLGMGYRWGEMQWLASVHRTWTAHDIDRINYSVGLAAALPRGQVVVQALQSRDRTWRSQDVRNLSLTFEYPMAARTVAYASYARNFNSAASTVALYQSPIAPAAAGSMPAAFALGMRTSF
ncbi:porin [Acidovorax sp. NCPPB 2350]|nr:porin [Acidovorax sp. NCPPB 2350]